MPSALPHLSGLRSVADQYDAFVLDIFGLLHNGIELYPGTIECLGELLSRDKKICLVSNTPRLPDEVRQDLAAKGLPENFYHHVVTAGLSARVDLMAHHRGQKIWFAGKDTFHGFVSGIDLEKVDDPVAADLVVNAISGLTAQTEAPLYASLQRALDAGKKMLCANPDMVVHIGPDMFLCAGTYAAWYEKHGGQVAYHGKPFRGIYDLALEKLGHPAPSSVCAMGDALHTDIQGANRMGFSSIWVLGGIHWDELRLNPADLTADLDRVAETLTISSHKPDADVKSLLLVRLTI